MLFFILLFTLICASYSNPLQEHHSRPATSSTENLAGSWEHRWLIKIDSEHRSGFIKSDPFPHTGGFRNSTYIYQFENRMSGHCTIKLHFTDFDLPFGSRIRTLQNDRYILLYEERSEGICDYRYKRPLTIHINESNHLYMEINVPATPSYSSHIGFKGTYESFKSEYDHGIIHEHGTFRSECPELLINRPSSLVGFGRHVDCIWVKCAANLWSENIRIGLVSENMNLVIRSGLNSEGEVLFNSSLSRSTWGDIPTRNGLYITTKRVKGSNYVRFQVISGHRPESRPSEPRGKLDQRSPKHHGSEYLPPTPSISTSTTTESSFRRRAFPTRRPLTRRPMTRWPTWRRRTTRRPWQPQDYDLADDDWADSYRKTSTPSLTYRYWTRPNIPNLDDPFVTVRYPIYENYDNSYGSADYAYGSSAVPIVGAVIGVILFKVLLISAIACARSQKRARVRRVILRNAYDGGPPTNQGVSGTPGGADVGEPPAVPYLFHQDGATAIVRPPTYEEVMGDGLPSYTEAVEAATNETAPQDGDPALPDEAEKVDTNDRVPILSNPPTA